ncbi:MAG: hypothetical protein SOW12_07120 [Lachnospiraceae bacterium]|nr:hypothetical protein [Lachnoclostridium sp.]MDY2599684.1 hypothetical protein [Lachnospiraceae bacterium]
MQKNKKQKSIVQKNVNIFDFEQRETIKRKKPRKVIISRVSNELISSFVFAVVSFSILIITSILSAISKGNAGIIAGILPMVAMIISIAGLVLAYRSLRNDDVKLKHVYTGLITNGLLVIVYLVLYIIGFAA